MYYYQKSPDRLVSYGVYSPEGRLLTIRAFQKEAKVVVNGLNNGSIDAASLGRTKAELIEALRAL